ncbi:immunoglobulin-like domain-containing protein [Clostridium thermarum]|uniref:immunoglobulin-like domain-containing protein n=1 Tax=Clostridium thermarum TaxID=1716543 RepID=UPI0013D7444A|nr:immunoglobulin-like domain-containing protein [Clostridium thermarum]
MKKIIKTLVILFLLAVISGGCSKSTLQEKSTIGDLLNIISEQEIKAKMSTENEEYSTSVNEIKVTIVNQDSTGISFGSYYRVEKFQDDSWYVVPFTKDLGFTSEEIILKPAEAYEFTVLTILLDYDLSKGKYRIVKDFQMDSKEIKLAAQFTIR